MIRITSLGGSGEDSRNCFLLQSDSCNVLLDCGVRREIAAVSRVYPNLTAEIVSSLDYVIISHAHEDHTAALPYLYELGYRKDIYASEETIELIPGYLRKWAEYVEKNNGILPFDKNNIDKLSYKPLKQLDLNIKYGRSGHMIGSLWYLFTMENHRILYTGDTTMDSLLLVTDPYPEADTVIIDSAYAGKVLDQKQQYRALAEYSRRNKGRLLLPVPANGRGIDMFEWLKSQKLNPSAENNILKNTASFFSEKDWIKDISSSEADYTAVTSEIRNSDLPGTYLFGDGMMTTAAAAEYFETVKDDPDSTIIISGHSAAGTLANNLLKEEYRRENNIKCRVVQLTIKVHLDEEDVLKVISQCRAQNVMLFHSRKKNCTALKKKLQNNSINVVCGTDDSLILN